jgi:hypothetical protein
MWREILAEPELDASWMGRFCRAFGREFGSVEFVNLLSAGISASPNFPRFHVPFLFSFRWFSYNMRVNSG